MKAKFLHICMLHFWALSLTASPLAVLVVPDDNAVLTLNTAGEEENGETDPPGPIQAKLIAPLQIPDFRLEPADQCQAPVTRPFAFRDFVTEVALPPPEGKPL